MKRTIITTVTLVYLSLALTLALAVYLSADASQEPKAPLTEFDYYCINYLGIHPDQATPEQENYFLDVFTETDEFFILKEELDSINAI